MQAKKSPSWTPKAKRSPDLKQLEGISFSSVSGAGPAPGSAAWRWENRRQLQSQAQTQNQLLPQRCHSCTTFAWHERGENSALLQPGAMAFAVQNQGTTGMSMGGKQKLSAMMQLQTTMMRMPHPAPALSIQPGPDPSLHKPGREWRDGARLGRVIDYREHPNRSLTPQAELYQDQQSLAGVMRHHRSNRENFWVSNSTKTHLFHPFWLPAGLGVVVGFCSVPAHPRNQTDLQAQSTSDL